MKGIDAEYGVLNVGTYLPDYMVYSSSWLS
jgi:hypothetical protein